MGATVRHELLDRTLVWNQRQRELLLSGFVGHFRRASAPPKRRRTSILRPARRERDRTRLLDPPHDHVCRARQRAPTRSLKHPQRGLPRSRTCQTPRARHGREEPRRDRRFKRGQQELGQGSPAGRVMGDAARNRPTRAGAGEGLWGGEHRWAPPSHRRLEFAPPEGRADPPLGMP